MSNTKNREPNAYIHPKEFNNNLASIGNKTVREISNRVHDPVDLISVKGKKPFFLKFQFAT